MQIQSQVGRANPSWCQADFVLILGENKPNKANRNDYLKAGVVPVAAAGVDGTSAT